MDIEIRIGIHSGGCIGSVISVNKPRYLIWGPNSNIANYLESTGVPGFIHISEYNFFFLYIIPLVKKSKFIS